MSVFWGLATIMIIIALLFTVPWLLRAERTPKKARPDLDTLNTEIIKAQLAELDTDLRMGRLDENQYAAARHDLERELLDDLSPAGAPATVKPARGGQWVVVLLVVAIPLMAVALYQQLGSKQIITLLEQGSAATATSGTPGQHEMGEHSLEQMVNVLAERLKDKPDDLRGWILLARSYETLNRYPDALGAYRNARRLSGDNPEVLADYADALVMANGGRFNDEAGEALQRAVEAEPNNVKALWLIGHWKNQQGSYTEAIDYWQRAAALLPAGSQDTVIIARQISQLQQRLGITPTTTVAVATPSPAVAPPTAGGGTAAAGQAITVTVALDPALTAQAAPESTVFIFARAVQGPRMPLAIIRRQVKDLPVTVTLDDSLAMSPAMTLSKFDQVTIGARVSASGNAMPQSGDLEGSQSPVSVTSPGTVAVTIDRKVP
ncbi:MAG: c-type cytochrome biogenesis protein CcmI [Gammaproteobacteria bacterium]